MRRVPPLALTRRCASVAAVPPPEGFQSICMSIVVLALKVFAGITKSVLVANVPAVASTLVFDARVHGWETGAA